MLKILCIFIGTYDYAYMFSIHSLLKCLIYHYLLEDLCIDKLKFAAYTKAFYCVQIACEHVPISKSLFLTSTRKDVLENYTKIIHM